MAARGRWAVVGASGFVGSSIAAELRAAGFDVVDVRAPRLHSESRAGGGVATVLSELAQNSVRSVIDALAADLEGCSVVINAAGVALPSSPPSTSLFGANALLPAVVRAAAEQAGATRFIHLSSAAVQDRRDPLDESAEVSPRTPYASAKALGEAVLNTQQATSMDTVIIRATSIHGDGRPTTASLTRLARSRLSSVAGSGNRPTPIASAAQLASAVRLVGDHPTSPPDIVLLPWQGTSTASALRSLGDREPVHLPIVLCRAVIASGYLASRLLGGRGRSTMRRIELLWFGQRQERGWLDRISPSVATPAVRVVVLTTVPLTAWTTMRGRLRYLAQAGFDVTLISSPGELLSAVGSREGIDTIALPMSREIDLLHDVQSLRRLRRVFRRLSPSVVIVTSPKAALLGGVVAMLARVPVRIYHLAGLRMETARGISRVVLWLAEWLALHTATHVVVESSSLLAKARELKLLGSHAGVVLGRGASNGVDLDRFTATADRRQAAVDQRAALGIPAGSFVFGFVGRVAADKGIAELVEAMRILSATSDAIWLVIVGDVEDVSAEVSAMISASPVIVNLGWQDDPAPLYHLFDALVLPSYREGLPTVCLEAAAAGKPVITTDVTGTVDSVLPGVTGSVVAARDAVGLTDAMRDMASDPERAASWGRAGRRLVEQYYSTEIVWESFRSYLNQAIDEADRRG